MQRLASIKLTFACLMTIVLLLAAGAGQGFFPEYNEIIESMNHTVLVDWFAANWHRSMILSVWLVLTTLTASVLFINIVCCTFTRQLNAALGIFSLEKWFFFILHLLFLIVLACHGISMGTGHKNSSVVLYKGDEFCFKDRYRITADAVEFGDDHSLLLMNREKRREEMTREKFHIKENFAVISVYENGKKRLTEKIFMLHPLYCKPFRITLTKFTIKEKKANAPKGIEVTISEDRLSFLFFIVYALMIITLACFTITTWRSSRKGDN